jgi:hypothetical protein
LRRNYPARNQACEEASFWPYIGEITHFDIQKM